MDIASPFSEYWHKIRRAEEHYNLLHAELTSFRESDPYPVIGEYDGKHAKYLLKLNNPKSMPQARWGLIIGDCVHNARTALDYLAWRLAGSLITDRQTLFPIYETKVGFRDMIRRRGLESRIHPEALDQIARLQPYHRSNPKEHPLWFLQELDARDKHKLITTTQTATLGGYFRTSSVGDIRGRVQTFDCALEHGAVVAEVSFPLGTTESEVEVDGQPMFGIAFEQGILDFYPDRRRSVSNCLGKIIEAVQVVVREFDNLIIANPSWLC